MGDVFLATRHVPEQPPFPVALKCMRPGIVGIEQFAESLEVEARIASRLQHPNVARIYEMGGHASAPFLAMEFLLGDTVERLLSACRSRDRRPTVAVVLRIIADAARGLHHAHTLTDADGQPMRIVHRDVSPQNLFVTFMGVTKVLDFGIATASVRLEQTVPGVLKGKFSYLSPERVRSAQSVDHRSDLFSLGIVLWEMLTGERLFAGGGMLGALHAVVSRPVPNVRSLRSDVSEELDAVVARMLDRRPNRRFPHAGAVVEALEDASPGCASEGEVAAFVHELVGDAIAQRRATVERLLGEQGIAALERRDVAFAFVPESDERVVTDELTREDTLPSGATPLPEYSVEPEVEMALGTMLAEWDRESASAVRLDASLRAIIDVPELSDTARIAMHDLALGLLTRAGAPLEVRAFHAERGSDPFLALALIDECGETALRYADPDSAIRWRRRGLEIARGALLRGELDDAEDAVIHFSLKLADVLLDRGDASTAHGILREAQDVALDDAQRAKLDERLATCGAARASSLPRASS